MQLELKKPIVFVDIEATGLDTQEDRIVELSMCKLNPDGSREIKTYRYNPGIPIPPATTEIHGITDDDVKDKPMFKQHAKGIVAFIENCDLAGFNSNRFDFPMLYAELRRAGVEWNYKQSQMIDVGNIFKIKEERTLAAAVKFYCERELEDAHSAEADILATIDVFLKQMDKYSDLPLEVDELAKFANYGSPILDLSGKFSMNDKGVIILNFGKYRGMPAAEHLDFLEWMVYKADFAPDTVAVAMSILNPEQVEDSEDEFEF